MNEARADLEHARTTARTTGARLSSLEAAGPDIERLEKERDTAKGDAASAIAHIHNLTEIADSLPSEADLGSAIDVALAAGSRIAEAKDVVDKAETFRATREAELADVSRASAIPNDSVRSNTSCEPTSGWWRTWRRPAPRSSGWRVSLPMPAQTLEQRTASSRAAEEALVAADDGVAAAGICRGRGAGGS